MKLRLASTLAALVVTRVATFSLIFAASAALAQQPGATLAVPELPASRASATAPAPPRGPRLRSPAETGARAAAPGDLKPVRPVKPQISIPFGKSPPPPSKREERVIKRNTAGSGGGVDDAAARCEAQVDNTLRAACRAQQARETKGQPAK